MTGHALLDKELHEDTVLLTALLLERFRILVTTRTILHLLWRRLNNLFEVLDNLRRI